MSIFKLVQKFSVRETVPVEVEHIVEFIRQLGIKDEIYFWEADFDPTILKATIIHWEYPDGNGGIVTVADIHTARSLPPHEKRLAQAKELLHILDPEYHRVNTLEDVEALIEKIVLPPELVDFNLDGVHANSDRAAMIHVIAVMFPWAARELLMGPLRDNKITLDRIADILDLPVNYVAFAMSDYWPPIHNSMMAPERARLPDKVTTLKADHSPIEVHSVPLGVDPYSYARDLHDRDRGSDKPIAAFLIESGNEKRNVSAAEIAGSQR